MTESNAYIAWFTYLILALGWVYLLTESAILRWLRLIIAPINPTTLTFIYCRACTGFWIGLLSTPLFPLRNSVPTAGAMLLSAFTIMLLGYAWTYYADNGSFAVEYPHIARAWMQCDPPRLTIPVTIYLAPEVVAGARVSRGDSDHGIAFNEPPPVPQDDEIATHNGTVMDQRVLRCPKHDAPEIASQDPSTRYACGCRDYDQRPGTHVSAPETDEPTV